MRKTRNALLLCLVFALVLTVFCAVSVCAEDNINVILDGKPLTFEVPPILVNDRTMVPMRAIFEELGAQVYWNNDSDTAMSVKNGKRVTVTIDDVNATVDGQLNVLDQPAILRNDRTLVPLRFVSEAFGAKVEWDDATSTVTITSSALQDGYFVPANAFSDLGSWSMVGTYLQGRTDGTPKAEADPELTANANYVFDVVKDGKYTLWVNSNDFATNQQGARYFHVSFDGVQFPEKQGAHGKEGFNWVKMGELDLKAGKHTFTLEDTSGFYARTQGFFLCADPNYIPAISLTDLEKDYPAVDPLLSMPAANFPAWAKQDVGATQAASLENDHIKLVFYQGVGAKGNVVQNEVFIKNGDNLIQTKAKNEELGFLMMAADSTRYISSPGGQNDAGPTLIHQSTTIDGEVKEGTVTDYYRTGIPYWFIPGGVEQVSDKEVRLTFPTKDDVTLTVTYALDDFAKDPKITLNASFGKDGSYSFMVFNGDGLTEYDTVTAPFLHVKHAIPETAIMISECYMYTPMATFTVTKDGQKITRGLAVDPTEGEQDFATPETSKFSAILRTPDGKARGQFAAPQPGSGVVNFKAGDTYSISYRMIEHANDWYDSFTYVAQDLYNNKDIRQNYYTSINEAIYNATDLMMDDYYGGWDAKEMAWYNMEARNVSSQSNVMAAAQRYLLTGDQEILEKRVIPTLAFALSRKSMHFSREDYVNSYTRGVSDLVGDPTLYNTAVYEGLYEMSQGRMPFMLDAAIKKLGKSSDYTGVTGQHAMYTASEKQDFLDKTNELVNNFYNNTLNPESEYMTDLNLTGGFVFGDYNYLLATFLTAYEMTGNQEYLDAAEKAGQLLVTSLWSTGYENGFDKNTYTVDPEATANAYLSYADQMKANWFWHGATKWRLGWPEEQWGWMDESPVKLTEETVPGWVPAKAGLGTEHAITASMSRAIYMNSWAGMLMRLGQYTGDEYFTTQARNAMVGRFGNYAGYYQDRYVVHQGKANYPYEGPDYTLIYWHHIPVFVSILEDYLISSVMATSDFKIDFPTIYQSGYAYFISGQYGHRPGTFYDEKDMWLWLDRDVVTPDSINADYIAVRKDGKMGAAFINETQEPLTTTVTLGSKVPGGSTFNGTAALYDQAGNKSTVTVANGQFTLTIPARGMQSVVIPISGMTKPAHALDEILYNAEIQGTVATHNNGKAYALQMEDSHYYAYVFVGDKELEKLEIEYTAGKQKDTVTVDSFPYEAIIRVDDPKAEFKYTVKAYKKGGAVTESAGVIKALTGGPTETNTTALEPPAPANWGDTKVVKTIATGMGIGEGTLRINVPVADFPFPVKIDNLVGCRIVGVLVDNVTGAEMVLDSIIEMNELRYSGTIFEVKATKDVPRQDYNNSHKGYFHVYPIGTEEIEIPDAKQMHLDATTLKNDNPANWGNMKAAKLNTTNVGVGEVMGKKCLRTVAWTKDYPVTVENGNLVLCTAEVEITNIATGEKLKTTGVVYKNEFSYSSTILSIVPDDADFEVKAYPPEEYKTVVKLMPPEKEKK